MDEIWEQLRDLLKNSEDSIASIARVTGNDRTSLQRLKNTGYDLQLMSWGDGSRVRTSGKRIVIVGTDAAGLLHIRIFDASGVRTDIYEAMEGGELHLVSADDSGKVRSDSPESGLSAAQSQAIATLKQQLPGWLPPHALSASQKRQVLAEAALVSGHAQMKNAGLSHKNTYALIKYYGGRIVLPGPLEVVRSDAKYKADFILLVKAGIIPTFSCEKIRLERGDTARPDGT